MPNLDEVFDRVLSSSTLPNQGVLPQATALEVGEIRIAASKEPRRSSRSPDRSGKRFKTVSLSPPVDSFLDRTPGIGMRLLDVTTRLDVDPARDNLGVGMRKIKRGMIIIAPVADQDRGDAITVLDGEVLAVAIYPQGVGRNETTIVEKIVTTCIVRHRRNPFGRPGST
ncbi:hypothetical protein GHT06_017003 [Daphnia sinensis]|uniref:Uncharacterized protein n=1 Tax=Daphnia sinensis TaxID=1820382 RepID=A0AAD5PRJ4_9CRUS|nr:hypothetical protein GHT06_017003 [Daphnia sinensis]